MLSRKHYIFPEEDLEQLMLTVFQRPHSDGIKKLFACGRVGKKGGRPSFF